ncbi:uncharacterized protein LOC143470530 [Clavelina lepadiformis]|uniref:Insulin-like domain-containing protein n=1 Tax=Clavelina lepadiformis TaxID=159417 RepID=A0ABP0H157_CLALP
MLKISRLQCSFFLLLSTCLFLSTLIPITIANPRSRACNMVDILRSICKDLIPISQRVHTEALKNKYRPRHSRKSPRITIISQGPRLSDMCCSKPCQPEDYAQICGRDYVDTHKTSIDNQLFERSSYNGAAPPNLQNLGLSSTEITVGTALCLEIAHKLKAILIASPEFMARYSNHRDEFHNILREPPRSTRRRQPHKPVQCHISGEPKHRSKKSVFRLNSATTEKPEYR